MPQKITVSNWIVAAYFLYIGFNIVTEWIYFFSWGAEISPSFGMPQAVSAILLGAFVWMTRPYWTVSALDLNREQIVGMMMIFLYGSVMSVYSDMAADTLSYHLLAQNPEFVNYFQSTSNSGFYVAWSFHLSDQMFYCFRYLLGYRMGTMLNTAVAIVAFTQVYALLGQISEMQRGANSRLERILSCRLLWTVLTLFSLDVIMMFGCYYIDLLAIPIGLEVFRLLLDSRRNLHGSVATVYFAFLNGCWIALKLTNIIYVIPCILIFLYFQVQKISWKTWLLSIVCFLIPFLSYLTFSYICTGNPLYPWFNAIFQSPYYPIDNFKDMNWGPKNLFEGVFWIFFAARHSEIPDLMPIGSFIGLFGAIVFAYFYFLKKHQEKGCLSTDVIESIKLLIILAFSVMVLWVMTTGYERYYIFGKILWNGVFCIFVMWLWRYAKWGKKIAATCMILACVAFSLNAGLSAAGRNWSWSGFHTRPFLPELQFVLRDRSESNSFPDYVDAFLLMKAEGIGIASMVGPQISTLYTGWKIIAPSYYEEFYHTLMKPENRVYDIHVRNMKDVKAYIQNLNAHKIKINHISTEYSRIGAYLLVAVHPMKTEENHVWLSDEEPLSLDVTGYFGYTELTFMGGTFWDIDRSGKEKRIRIVETKKGQELEIADLSLDISRVDTLTVPLVFDGTQDKIRISACYADGSPLDESDKNKVFVINPTIRMMTNEGAR
ncbi:MAG: hypothetical protein ACFN4Y_00710 [Centipeda sp. (in: firmicutes)]